MASPITLNDIVPGAILTGSTPNGKPQVRLVLDVDEEGLYNGKFQDQLIEDGCCYLVLSGPRNGKTGRCTRHSLMSWARKLKHTKGRKGAKGDT